MIGKILAAIDGSAHAWKALDLAIDMAKRYDAELVVLHVVPNEPIPEALRQIATIEHLSIEEEVARFHYARTLGDRLTGEGEARARKAGLERVVAVTAEGRPAREILTVASARDVDAIVLGSRGFGEVKGLLLGSVSQRVGHLAACICITVK
jgi:nucleotide-binding universal stress UspA family protein